MNEYLSGPRILAMVPDMSGPSLWRCLMPFTELQKRGYPADWDMKDNPLMSQIAPMYDGYLLMRTSWMPEHRKIAQAWFDSIRRAGKFVVMDLDDDVLTASETHRRVELDWTEGKSYERLEQERYERIWAVRQADGCTVSTPRLATVVRQYTDRPVIVVANSLDLKWFQSVVRSTKRQVPGLTIGWAGGRRHDRDVEQMAEAWGRIAGRYQDVTFIAQGWLPDVIVASAASRRLIHLPWMPLEAYPSGIAQIDIGCAAVSSTPFNRAKSPIKAYEYAGAGAAVVASPTLYSAVIDHGYSGFIANDADEWEEALSRLIESHALRKMTAARLLKVVAKKYSLSANLYRWPLAWSAIANSKSGIIQVRNASA